MNGTSIFYNLKVITDLVKKYCNFIFDYYSDNYVALNYKSDSTPFEHVTYINSTIDHN